MQRSMTGLFPGVALAVLASGAAPADCVRSATAWEASYNSPDNRDDSVNAVAADPAGGFAAAGYETRLDLGEAENWVVRRYTGDGNAVWSRTYNFGGASSDIAYAVAVDPAGNVIAGGTAKYLWDTSGFLRVAKYSPSGDLLWSRTHNTPGVNQENSLTALAVDRSDSSIVAAGWVDRPDLGRSHDWILLKYSAAGDRLWATVYHGGGQDQAWCVAVDPAGNIIAGGFIGAAPGGVIRKYDSAGGLVWSQSVGTAAGPCSRVDGITTDQTGNIYAVGQQSTTGGDWFVQKLDPTGAVA